MIQPFIIKDLGSIIQINSVDIRISLRIKHCEIIFQLSHISVSLCCKLAGSVSYNPCSTLKVNMMCMSIVVCCQTSANVQCIERENMKLNRDEFYAGTPKH